MKRFVLSVFFLWAMLMGGVVVSPLAFAEDVEVQTEQLVGKILSVNAEDQSFDLDYVADEVTGEKKTSTFYVTDITTIDIAMTQVNLIDLIAGMNVLVEYATMPDGTRVVESVWVKSE